MRHRKITNSALAVCGTFSFIGWLGPPTLKLINFVQFAVELREMMNLVAIKDVSISWGGIYLFLFIASVVGIVSINLDLVQKYIRRKKEAYYREWNMNGCDAINYIGNSSYIGKAFQVNTGHKLSISTFYEAAKTGKIRVGGIADGSSLLGNVPRQIWNGKNILDTKGCVSSTRELMLCIRKDQDKILYWGLMVDRREIEKTWPKAPTRYDWMGT